LSAVPTLEDGEADLPDVPSPSDDAPPALPDDAAPSPSDDAAPAPRRRSLGFLVAVTLAAVFFVTTVAFAVIAVSEKGENDDLTGERDAVTEVAGQFMDALLRFDHADPEANRQAVLALSAAQFRTQFEDAFDENAALYEEFQAVATPTIKGVYVSDISDDQAQAIVEYDRIIETADRTNTEDGFYAQLQLARIDGKWLVTNVFNINFALGAAGNAGAPDTTTTTVVPPP